MEDAAGQGDGADAVELVGALRRGLPVGELETLRERLEVTLEQLVPLVGLSRATLHRRKQSGRLDLEESDRVVRFAHLLGLAASVMGDLEAGRRWLKAPQRALGGCAPLELAESERGAREVERVLGRLEQGVYT